MAIETTGLPAKAGCPMSISSFWDNHTGYHLDPASYLKRWVFLTHPKRLVFLPGGEFRNSSNTEPSPVLLQVTEAELMEGEGAVPTSFLFECAASKKNHCSSLPPQGQSLCLPELVSNQRNWKKDTRMKHLQRLQRTKKSYFTPSHSWCHAQALKLLVMSCKHKNLWCLSFLLHLHS